MYIWYYIKVFPSMAGRRCPNSLLKQPPGLDISTVNPSKFTRAYHPVMVYFMVWLEKIAY